MAISLTKRVLMPSDVLTCELEGESVLLNLKSERYFGLGEVGSRMWKVLTTSESIQAAYQVLLAEYAVDPEQLSQSGRGRAAQVRQHTEELFARARGTDDVH